VIIPLAPPSSSAKVSAKISEKVEELREATRMLEELRVAREKARALEVLRERRRQVEEKLKRGEPLTIDELRVLYASSLEELEEEGDGEEGKEATGAGS